MGNSTVFIRHPDEFPIEFDLTESTSTPNPLASLQLVCHSSTPFQSGEVIAIKIPSISPQLKINGTVESCENKQEGYELGIAFNNDALMRIRMLEQLCYIQRYRNHVLAIEGRDISDQDAALEWIGKYAHLFPCSS